MQRKYPTTLLLQPDYKNHMEVKRTSLLPLILVLGHGFPEGNLCQTNRDTAEMKYVSQGSQRPIVNPNPVRVYTSWSEYL